MSEPTHGLVLWQPWASLVVQGVKTIETRSWAWPSTVELPARIAIYATKKKPGETFGPLDIESGRGDGYWLMDAEGNEWIHLPLGGVVGTVTVVEDLPMVSWTSGLDGPATWACRLRNYDGPSEAILLRDAMNAAESIARLGPLPSSIDLTDQLPFGDFTPGRHGFLLADPVVFDQPITSYPCPADLEVHEPHLVTGRGVHETRWCATFEGSGLVPVRGRQRLFPLDPALARYLAEVS